MSRLRDASVTRCTCGNWRLKARPCTACGVKA